MKIRDFLLKHWLLLVVLAVGAFLRFYGLLDSPISLYSDEVDLGYQAYSLIKTGCDYSGYCLPLQFHSFGDVRTPIPIYLTAIVHLLGVPLDLAIRLIPAIFGFLGILSTYLLLRNLAEREIFDLKLPKLGLFGALVLTLIPWHFTYSRIGFELTILYFFVVHGLYLFTKYIIERRVSLILISSLLLGLTPMIYSTAKLFVMLFPLVLLSFPGSLSLLKKNNYFKTSLLILFLPLAVLVLNGGAASRFSYISVFTDPTLKPEVNLSRLEDLGPMPPVGSAPSLPSRLFHNRPLMIADTIIRNTYKLFSTDFLFLSGDPNLRHSPASSGMLYRTIAPLLLLGLYFLIRYSHNKIFLFIFLLLATAISGSVLTRDGGNHASRSFMMVLPLVLLSGIGLAYLYEQKKVIFCIFALAILAESTFFIHDYWYHYRYASERVFSAGVKEVVSLTMKQPDSPVIISPKYEHPLIFYLYYTRFDPSRFQQFAKSKTVYNSTEGKNNLEGNRIGDTNFYIATMIDYKKKPDSLPNAFYYLTRAEADIVELGLTGKKSAIINLPSGEPLYYEIHF